MDTNKKLVVVVVVVVTIDSRRSVFLSLARSLALSLLCLTSSVCL